MMNATLRRRTFQPVMECCEDRFLMSSVAINPVFHGVGTDVWKQIANPAKPGTFLPSYYSGGHLEGAITKGGGNVSATYMVTGLTQGYYRVDVYYDAMPGNAKSVSVSYKTASNTGFQLLPTKIDETTGTPDVPGAKPVAGVLPVWTTATPFKTNNASSYIWVPTVSGNTPLSIMISDSGDSSGRLIVADAIRLTLVSTTK